MKLVHLVIFLSIVLSVYGLVNWYIFIRGWQAIPKLPVVKAGYLFISLGLIFSFIVGRYIERVSASEVSGILIWIGSFWLSMMTYLLIGIILVDFLRALDYFFPFFPSSVTVNYPKTKMVTLAVIVSTSLMIVVFGFFNARNPVIRRLELRIPKKAGALRSLKIAMASDIHLGRIISNSRLENMVNMINGISPDIILLAGDIVDEDLTPVIHKDLGRTLTRLRSRYGTYAITGNHEFIGGIKESEKYLTDHHITLLRDAYEKVDNCFYIVGRDDRGVKRFTGKTRKPLGDIIAGIDRDLPVILMDHQPFTLSDAVDEGIDIQLSGHTHHGQVWPYNMITSMIFEISRGYARIGGTQFYVSCGFGTWGPAIRTSSRPEVVEITLHFSPHAFEKARNTVEPGAL